MREGRCELLPAVLERIQHNGLQQDGSDVLSANFDSLARVEWVGRGQERECFETDQDGNGACDAQAGGSERE